MLPNFVVIGAQKAGTTSLIHYLSSHPSVFVAAPPEVRYFVEERHWSRGQAWYEELFDGAGGATAIGEKTVAYTMYPRFAGVPERMAGVIPDARLIYLVRDPVSRTLSHYRNFALRGSERRPATQALLEDTVYVDPSRYAFQLEQYLPYFARERILVVTNEAMAADPEAMLSRVAAFLGLANEWPKEELARRQNVTDTKRRPRGPFGRLKRLPGWKPLKRSLPAPARDRIRALTHTSDTRVELPETVVRELEARLRDDAAALREQWLDPSFDGWELLRAGR